MLEKMNNKTEDFNVPEKLNDEEIKMIVAKVNDERLHTDEDLEHFTIHLAEQKIVNVPKRKTIQIRGALGFISSVKIEEHIKKVIEDYDKEQKES